ncbi:hypothetical protein ACHAPM_010242 [Fusarium culmorum]|uniref:Uncharacterized protein n=1 Tax=Fusarium culmorum TaxID=5516 RepID=A0A2T4H609_FUSCU|nr:hypothetical protein FCULG_00003777 [Fusarium culmorum]
MSDTQEQYQILEIPPQLYDKLTGWCHLPSAPKNSTTAQEWTELLSTQEFTGVVLNDTSNNLIGLLRAFSAFPYENKLDAAIRAIKSFSITLKGPSKHDDQQRAVFGDLPGALAKGICRMTSLQAICLNLGAFTVEDGQKLFNGIIIGQSGLIWPKMHSIRVRGRHVQPAGIMSRCSEFNLKALDLDEWVFSRGFIKTIAVETLKSLRLYFDKDRMLDSESSNMTFPSLDPMTWGKLSRLGPKTAFIGILGEVKLSKLTRFAFHFDCRRFSPRVIRIDLGIPNPTSRPLEPHEIKQWHSMRIKYLMEVQTLQEVCIFINSSLAFTGIRNSDETVTVKHRKFNDETDQTRFPLGLLNE